MIEIVTGMGTAGGDLDGALRQMLEHTPDVMFLLRPDGVCQGVSPSIRSRLGYEPAAILGTRPQVISAVDRDRAAQALGDALRGKLPHLTVDLRVDRTDGSALEMTAGADLWWDDDGDLVGWVVTLRDRRGGAADRERLGTSEQRFRHAMQAPPIGMCVVAADGTFLTVNPALCDLFGLDEGALLASDWRELTHPDDLDTDLSLMQEVLAGERDSYRLLKRYLRSNGAVVWGDLSVSCARDADGAVVQFVCQVADVTAQRRAEESLARSEERYRSLVQHMGDVVIVLDDGVISWASPSIGWQLGGTTDDWVGVDVAQRVHPDDRDQVAVIRQRLATGESVRATVRLRDHDGDYRWVEGVATHPADEGDGQRVFSLRVVDETVARENALRRIAGEDSLTGLSTRRELHDRLHRVLTDQRHGGRPAVLFCDLDNFKEINDQHGHGVGDVALAGVSDRIRQEIRTNDFAARLGGDELVVVLQGVHRVTEAAEVAEDIRRAVARPLDVPGASIVEVTVSIGVALADDDEDVDTLLARADKALYQAKSRGRNQVAVALPETGVGDLRAPHTRSEGR